MNRTDIRPNYMPNHVRIFPADERQSAKTPRDITLPAIPTSWMAHRIVDPHIVYDIGDRKHRNLNISAVTTTHFFLLATYRRRGTAGRTRLRLFCDIIQVFTALAKATVSLFLGPRTTANTVDLAIGGTKRRCLGQRSTWNFNKTQAPQAGFAAG